MLHEYNEDDDIPLLLFCMKIAIAIAIAIALPPFLESDQNPFLTTSST